MPGTAFVTRPSAIFQGFLVGMFLDGAMRWGMDSILQSPASLVGDGALGTALPIFLTNSTSFASAVSDGVIRWMGVDEAGVTSKGWNGFALLVDDVLKQTGAATNFSLAGLDSGVVHYFRCVVWLRRLPRPTISMPLTTHSRTRAGSPTSRTAPRATLPRPRRPSSPTRLGSTLPPVPLSARVVRLVAFDSSLL